MKKQEILKIVWFNEGNCQYWELYDPAVHETVREYLLCEVIPETGFEQTVFEQIDMLKKPHVGEMGYTIENYFVKVLAVVPV